jgi:predicted XRE-type DNA-binding protein
MPVNNIQRFSTVWDALFDTPHERESMRVRSALLMRLTDHLQKIKRTHCFNNSDLARHFRIAQPCISEIMAGKLHKFTIERLLKLSDKSGLAVTLSINTPKELH